MLPLPGRINPGVRSSYRRPLLLVVLLALCCGEARAQGSGIDYTGTGGRHVIRGRILFPSGRRVDTGLKVRLESTGFGDISVLSDANGSFVFQSLRPGVYTVVIEGGEDFETVREKVVIESEGLSARRGTGLNSPARPYTVQIYLQPKRLKAVGARPGVINAALAGVPKPALELYERALEAERKGETEKAVARLKEAIAAHPDFALALSKLGMQYLKLKQPDKAAEALRASLKLLPGDAAAHLAYGIALFEKEQLAEAEAQLREVLKKNSSSPMAHYYLGVTLLKQRKLDEAEKELQQAAAAGGAQLGRAHFYLGGLYWGKRDYRRAADALETYLRLTPKAPDAERVRATIKELRSKQP